MYDNEVYVLCDLWSQAMYEDSDYGTDVLGVFETKEKAEEARKLVYTRTKELDETFKADEDDKYSYEVNELNKYGDEVRVLHTLRISCDVPNRLGLIN